MLMYAILSYIFIHSRLLRRRAPYPTARTPFIPAPPPAHTSRACAHAHHTARRCHNSAARPPAPPAAPHPDRLHIHTVLRAL